MSTKISFLEFILECRLGKLLKQQWGPPYPSRRLYNLSSLPSDNVQTRTWLLAGKGNLTLLDKESSQTDPMYGKLWSSSCDLLNIYLSQTYQTADTYLEHFSLFSFLLRTNQLHVLLTAKNHLRKRPLNSSVVILNAFTLACCTEGLKSTGTRCHTLWPIFYSASLACTFLHIHGAAILSIPMLQDGEYPHHDGPLSSLPDPLSGLVGTPPPV